MALRFRRAFAEEEQHLAVIRDLMERCAMTEAGAA
jgi:hypothetical protein